MLPARLALVARCNDFTALGAPHGRPESGIARLTSLSEMIHHTTYHVKLLRGAEAMQSGGKARRVAVLPMQSTHTIRPEQRLGGLFPIKHFQIPAYPHREWMVLSVGAPTYR
jgi:hypothetical protein